MQKFDVRTHVHVTCFKFCSKLNPYKLNFFKHQWSLRKDTQFESKLHFNDRIMKMRSTSYV